MATKVFLPEETGTKLKTLKAQLLSYVSINEGITNEEIATKAGVPVTFVDALLAELSNESKVKLYI